MANPGYQPAVLGDTAPSSLKEAITARAVRRLVDVINRMLQGRLNVTLPVTLAVSATTTTVIDSRINAFCAVVFTPLTADAAAEIGNGTIYVSAQQNGQLTLTHASNTQADRNFTLAFIG
jgi:hypothetical protein